MKQRLDSRFQQAKKIAGAGARGAWDVLSPLAIAYKNMAISLKDGVQAYGGPAVTKCMGVVKSIKDHPPTATSTAKFVKDCASSVVDAMKSAPSAVSAVGHVVKNPADHPMIVGSFVVLLAATLSVSIDLGVGGAVYSVGLSIKDAGNFGVATIANIWQSDSQDKITIAPQTAGEVALNAIGAILPKELKATIENGLISIVITYGMKREMVGNIINAIQNPKQLYHAVPDSGADGFYTTDLGSQENYWRLMERLHTFTPEEYLERCGLHKEQWEFQAEDKVERTIQFIAHHEDGVVKMAQERVLSIINDEVLEKAKAPDYIAVARGSYDKYGIGYTLRGHNVLAIEESAQVRSKYKAGINDTVIVYNYGLLQLHMERCDGSSPPVIAVTSQNYVPNSIKLLINQECLVRWLCKQTGGVMIGKDGRVITCNLVEGKAPPVPKIDYKMTALIDTSGSMDAGRLTNAKQALKDVVKGINREVQAGSPQSFTLINFADSVKLKEFMIKGDAASVSAIANEVDSYRAVGGTALYNAVIQALDGVTPANGHIIILLTDGSDSGGRASLRDVQNRLSAALLKQSQIKILTVAIDATSSTSKALQDFAENTLGGKYVKSASSALPYILGQELDNIRKEIVLYLEGGKGEYPTMVNTHHQLRPGNKITINGQKYTIGMGNTDNTASGAKNSAKSWFGHLFANAEEVGESWIEYGGSSYYDQDEAPEFNLAHHYLPSTSQPDVMGAGAALSYLE